MLKSNQEDYFKRQLALGHQVEHQMGEWFMRNGYRILPVYDYSGLNDDKAPKLSASMSTESLVVPDLLICRDGKTQWCEIKYKTRADFTHITNRLETGINRRLWWHYNQVQDISGLEVVILFVHNQEGRIVGTTLNRLHDLDTREYRGTKMGNSGMMFFPFEELPIVGEWARL